MTISRRKWHATNHQWKQNTNIRQWSYKSVSAKKEEYDKLLKDSITTTYKKLNKKIGKQISLDGKNIVKDEIIANRILVNGHDECFISPKDHKPDFTNNPKTRLNPSKNEIDRLRKSILDKINNKLRNTTSLNQWKDKSEVVNWFNKIEEKSKHTFIVFDVKDFYTSISTKSPRVCQSKSITPTRRKDSLPF